MAKYSKVAQKKVERALHERKRGQLKSGGSGKTVKSRKQAIAIGLSEARRAGAKVPKKGARKTATKTTRKSAAKKTTAKKKGRPAAKRGAKKSTKKSSKRARKS
jgi:hypothetical protein